jgi:hypothetical protein
MFLYIIHKKETRKTLERKTIERVIHSARVFSKMATACCRGVESDKLMYPSMFGNVPSCVYLSYGQAAEKVVCVRGMLLGGIMSDNNLERWINIKFYLKIGKHPSETLALLTLACGECAMKKMSVSKCHRQFKEG